MKSNYFSWIFPSQNWDSLEIYVELQLSENSSTLRHSLIYAATMNMLLGIYIISFTLMLEKVLISIFENSDKKVNLFDSTEKWYTVRAICECVLLFEYTEVCIYVNIIISTVKIVRLFLILIKNLSSLVDCVILPLDSCLYVTDRDW